jgi:hypothetical protein
MIVCERTGRTLDELYNGGPGKEPMTTAEFNQWAALIRYVEPHEIEQAREAAKNKRQ